MSQFGIYQSPPATPPYTFKVTDPDLNDPLGGGFQAAHVWVNNHGSNAWLFLPDGPDLVPPGVTRVVALSGTDVARATWKIPPAFAVIQPAQKVGAAILIFLSAGVDVSPSPGVTSRVATVQSARPRGWFVQDSSLPGAGLTAAIVFAGVVGMRYVLTMAIGHYVSTVAAADGAGFQISDTNDVHLFYREVSGTEAVIGSTDRVGSTTMAIMPGIGQALNVKFISAPQNANNFQSCAAGAYLITDEEPV